MLTLDLSMLPASVQRALHDFYEFLQQKHTNKFVNPVVPASEQHWAKLISFRTFMMNTPKMEGCIRATTA